MKHNSNVPAFLTKLWTLVEDENTNEFICWSQGGNSFMVLDEQRFAKEILPKFFKHNNMASFIRQLNMYGFRKVMHIDTGIVKQEKDGPVEFQHPYFKHGQDELLENIKRKVSNTRPEDAKIRKDDVSKIFATVHSVHSKQENTDARLATLERENKALWREIADLTQKHAHQQQLIKKLVHFIVTLVQKNRIINLKRKRPILMKDNGKMPKCNYHIYKDVCVEQSSVSTLSSVRGPEISDDVFTCDMTANEAESTADVTEDSTRAYEQSDVEIVEVKTDDRSVLPAETEVGAACTDEKRKELDRLAAAESGQHGRGAAGSPSQPNKPSGLSQEDPVKMMDTILTENGVISQNINLLGKVDLMDYLDSIDCSLEDFQAMLCGKPFGVDFDIMEESLSLKESSAQVQTGQQEENGNTHKQLIQYTSSPLLAFIDGCTSPSELDLAASSRSARSSRANLQLLSSGPGSPAGAEPALELLSDSPEPKPSLGNPLIRLEPLTEAQASEETIFYLSELSPAGGEADPVQLVGETSARTVTSPQYFYTV